MVAVVVVVVVVVVVAEEEGVWRVRRRADRRLAPSCSSTFELWAVERDDVWAVEGVEWVEEWVREWVEEGVEEEGVEKVVDDDEVVGEEVAEEDGPGLEGS